MLMNLPSCWFIALIASLSDVVADICKLGNGPEEYTSKCEKLRLTEIYFLSRIMRIVTMNTIS